MKLKRFTKQPFQSSPLSRNQSRHFLNLEILTDGDDDADDGGDDGDDDDDDGGHDANDELMMVGLTSLVLGWKCSTLPSSSLCRRHCRLHIT